MKKLLFLFCGSLLLTNHVLSQTQQEWIRVDSCGYFNYDVSTRKISHPGPNVVEALIKITLQDSSSIGRKAYEELRSENHLRVEEYENFSHTLQIQQLNCSSKQRRDINFTEYDSAGKVLDTWTVQEGVWLDVAPKSIHEALFNAVCKP